MVAESGREYYDGRNSAQHLEAVKEALRTLGTDAIEAQRANVLAEVMACSGIADEATVISHLKSIVDESIGAMKALLDTIPPPKW